MLIGVGLGVEVDCVHCENTIGRADFDEGRSIVGYLLSKKTKTPRD